MNTITKIPYYNQETNVLYINHLFQNNLVEQVFPDRRNFHLLITTITKEQSVKLTLYKMEGLMEEEVIELKRELFPIPIDNILAHGNGNEKNTYFNSILQVKRANRFSSSKTDRFRNYQQSFEKWNNECYVNSCPEGRMSYESILRKLGCNWARGMNNTKEPFYTAIWVVSKMSNEEISEQYGL